MSLILYPKIARSDKLRVWIGAFNKTAVPILNWAIRGISDATAQPNQMPSAIREIESVRPPDLLKGNPPRAYSGIYEFDGCLPDTMYQITATSDSGESISIKVKTIPEEIPQDRAFNVLLVSCYHNSRDPNGISGEVINRIKPRYTPDMTILMGDQVYLDLPTLKDFPDDAIWLADKFEKDYVSNWLGINTSLADMDDLHGYPKILAAAPSLSIPDDHEYWNNYPHTSPVVGNSLKSGGRIRWEKAADAVYKGFQVHEPASFGRPVIVDMSELSFFIADTRRYRDFNLKYILDQTSFQMLRKWVDDLIVNQKFGVFISGQSLFTNKVSDWAGKVEDYELPNYADYENLMNELKRASEIGLQVTCVTGDVHWGRVAYASRSGEGSPDMVEVITSPSSLVETVGKDQWSGLKSFVTGIFGSKNPWPLHSDGDEVPEKITGMNCTTKHKQKGNQVAVLSFSRSGDGLDCKVTYFPIHTDTGMNNKIVEISLPKLLKRN